MRYVISYDLNRPQQNYEQLYAQLRALGAAPLLFSQWNVRRNGTNAANLRNFVHPFIDANDRLLVTCLDGPDWAGVNLMAQIDNI